MQRKYRADRKLFRLSLCQVHTGGAGPCPRAQSRPGTRYSQTQEPAAQTERCRQDAMQTRSPQNPTNVVWISPSSSARFNHYIFPQRDIQPSADERAGLHFSPCCTVTALGLGVRLALHKPQNRTFHLRSSSFITACVSCM